MESGFYLNLADMLVNAAIIFFMVKSIIGFFTRGGRGNMEVSGTVSFRYFTVDSNLLMAAASCAGLVCNIIYIARGGAQPPYAVTLLRFIGTVAVMLTFSVVFFIFVPSSGVAPMIEGDNLFMHLISPLIAMASIIFLERGGRLAWTALLWGMLPTAVYACVYYFMVMRKGPEKGGWEDFYYFNAKGRWYVSAAVIFLMTLLLGALMLIGHDLIAAGVLAD